MQREESRLTKRHGLIGFSCSRLFCYGSGVWSGHPRCVWSALFVGDTIRDAEITLQVLVDCRHELQVTKPAIRAAHPHSQSPLPQNPKE